MRLGLGIMSVAAVAISFVAPPQEAKAWGELGHLTVCDLAYRNFTPQTRVALDTLFQPRAGGVHIPTSGDQEGRVYTSFNVGCLEEDERPRKHPKDHFINVDRWVQAITDGTCPLSPTTGQPGKCIFEGIERDLRILKDATKSRQERVIALMAIGHWVGDIHQPLHISYEDDAGGNGIDVQFKGQCGPSRTSSKPYRPGNLHAVWDNCLLQNGIFQRVRERQDFKASWGWRTITYRAVDTLKANTSLAQERSYVASEPWQWAAESYAITRDPGVQYCVMVGTRCQYSATQPILHDGDAARKAVVGADYLKAYKDIAGERVAKAGFRLAHLINLALDPNYTQPTE